MPATMSIFERALLSVVQRLISPQIPMSEVRIQSRMDDNAKLAQTAAGSDAIKVDPITSRILSLLSKWIKPIWSRQ